MGLIRFIQAHNRNEELKNMRQLKEQELAVIENKELNEVSSNLETDEYKILRNRFAKGEISQEEYEKMKEILDK